MEPKYRLNREQAARFRVLARREAMGTLAPAEKLELERLDRERHRRFWRHPRMQRIKRETRNHNRKIQRLFLKLKKLTET